MRLLRKIWRKLSKRVRLHIFGRLVRVVSIDDLPNKKYEKIRSLPPETIPTPESEKLCFNAVLHYLKADTYSTPDMYVTHLKGVLYCPECDVVLTESREIISESVISPWNPVSVSVPRIDLRSLYRRNPEIISGYCSIIRGNPFGYWHTIFDNVPRSFLLNQPEFASLDEIKILSHDGIPNYLKELEEFFVYKLAPSNAKLTTIPRNRLYYIENLILPSFLTKRGSGYLPSPYLEKLRSEVLPKRPRRKKNRIFISRAMRAGETNKRHILNEDELFGKLKGMGFEKYVLEEYSIEEKIELFYDAEIVVGGEGAGLAHILFSDKIDVIVLTPRQKMYSMFYYACKCLGHNYRYWSGDETLPNVNFKVDVEKVLKLI